MATVVYYEGTDDVGAWYVDGRLMAEGEQHAILEQVFAEFGVEHRMSNEFLRGTAGSATTAAPDLDAITKWTLDQAEREFLANRARELRESADASIAEAAQIELKLGKRPARR